MVVCQWQYGSTGDVIEISTQKQDHETLFVRKGGCMVSKSPTSMPRITPQQRAQIQALWQLGLHNYAAIGRRVGVDPKTVACWAKRPTIQEKSRSGRPHVMNNKQKSALVSMAKRHNRYSSAKLRPMAAKMLHHSIGASTIRRVLNQQELYWLPLEEEPVGLDEAH